VSVVPCASGASPARSSKRITELFVDNLRRYLDGEPLVNVVEPGVFY
jgi:phosphoglycerate dehydrogenase-like enzyme